MSVRVVESHGGIRAPPRMVFLKPVSSMNSIQSNGFDLRPTSIDERRKLRRRSATDDAVIQVIDGLGSGERFGVGLREIPGVEITFLSKIPLAVGQMIRVELGDEEDVATRRAEVTRSRLISVGRYEIAAEYREAPAPPRISESQRRHEKRRARLEASIHARPKQASRTSPVL